MHRNSIRAIFLNGPPGAGKDFAAESILSLYRVIEDRTRDDNVYAMRKGFADELKNMTHRAYGINVEYNEFEAVKNIPWLAFNGVVPRQAYIAMSEAYVKPLHGELYFSNYWANQVIKQRNAMKYMKHYKNGNLIVVAPDAGFLPEVVNAVTRIGVENCLFLEIHRGGHDFSNDSRSYISGGLSVALPDLPQLSIINDSGEAYVSEVLKVILDWLKRLDGTVTPTPEA